MQAGSHPAVCISWEDAKAYVAWLSRKTGKGYRLLSEAEWEYVARAGTTTRYFFGNDEKDTFGYANGDGKCDGYAYSSPVGKFAQNGFGLYDMHGNAWQWVGDCWHDSYTWAPSDGAAWTSGDCRERVLRGGSWGNSPGDLRSALRYRYLTLVRYNINGFRLGRTLAP